jgi:hypothetical protein
VKRPAPGGSWRRTGSSSSATDNRLPNDGMMRAWRLAGQFICTCSLPAPRVIGAFGARECTQCWKPLLHRESVTDVITGVLDELA